jgi:hypothetical protein
MKKPVCDGKSGLHFPKTATSLKNPSSVCTGSSRLVAGDCFRPGGLRRCLFDVGPARRPRKAKKIKRENGKRVSGRRRGSSEFKLIQNEHAQFGHALQLLIICQNRLAIELQCCCDL